MMMKKMALRLGIGVLAVISLTTTIAPLQAQAATSGSGYINCASLGREAAGVGQANSVRVSVTSSTTGFYALAGSPARLRVLSGRSATNYWVEGTPSVTHSGDCSIY